MPLLALVPFDRLERWSVLGIVVSVAAILAWAWARTRGRVQPSRGCIADAIALAVVSCTVLILEARPMRSAGTIVDLDAAVPWRHVDGFEPIPVFGRPTCWYSCCQGPDDNWLIPASPDDMDAMVTREVVRPRDGRSVPLASLGTPSGRDALSGILQKRLRTRFVERDGDRTYSFHALGYDAFENYPSPPWLVLVIDGRTSAATLRTVLEAAESAGARSVCALGDPFAQVRGEVERLSASNAPAAFTRFATLPGARLVSFETALPNGAADRDDRLLHATVRGPGTFVLQPRARAGAPERIPERSAPRFEQISYDIRERQILDPQNAYLALGSTATAADFFDAADRAAEFGFVPVVVLGREFPWDR